ncbi:ciliary microtubule inner protein 2B [Danio rerio]|uniref:Ciliary microtubule inner protein 2B n=2 Tax=Danio rerio TaxID=7955 RepID=A0A0R4I9Q0_DANRE|nr:ciliary microtubule inner protein 2B [Danio rerio]|eukprot:NP_001076489.2 protein FAM166B [Danio rerio]
MDLFPPKFSKVLVTPDPQYIPGYAGYCPQLKYHVGQTYGQLTAKLLTSPEVSHSQRLVLQTSPLSSTEKETASRSQIWWSRHGASRNLETMIPGYTGFVPLRQNYICKTYAETCRDALSEFNQEQAKRLHNASADLSFPVINSVPDFRPRRSNSPLIALSKDPAPYKAPDPWKPPGSPYFMEDSSPHKYFISGFTGYVPKARFLFGTGYPTITNKALIQFSKEMKAGPASLQKYSLQEEDSSNLPLIPTIYPSKTGLLPSYTGHIPGYRFQYGHTFGKLTHNALGHTASQKNAGAIRLS